MQIHNLAMQVNQVYKTVLKNLIIHLTNIVYCVSDRRRGLHRGHPPSPRPAHRQPIATIHTLHRETEQTRYWVRVTVSHSASRPAYEHRHDRKFMLFI